MTEVRYAGATFYEFPFYPDGIGMMPKHFGMKVSTAIVVEDAPDYESLEIASEQLAREWWNLKEGLNDLACLFSEKCEEMQWAIGVNQDLTRRMAEADDERFLEELEASELARSFDLNLRDLAIYLDSMLTLVDLFEEKCAEVEQLKAALRDIALRKGLVVSPGEVRVKEHKRPKPRPKTKPQKWDETICPECGKTLGEPNPGCSFTHFIHSHVERCEFCGVERTGNEHPSPLCQGAVLGIKPEGHKWRVVGPGTVTWENLPNPPSVQESLPEATTEPQRPVEPVARPICRDGAPMPQAQPSEATEASEEEGALPRLRVLVDGEYEEASDALVDTVNGIRLALSGITVWNCEGCGKPISKYPCKCGYPES